MMIKRNLPPFFCNLKAETIINEINLVICLNQFILRLYQIFKNILENDLVGLLIHLQIIFIMFQNMIL